MLSAKMAKLTGERMHRIQRNKRKALLREQEYFQLKVIKVLKFYEDFACV